MMPRVKSKNLFNFQPAGVIDNDIVAIEAQMNKATPTAKEKNEDTTITTKVAEVSSNDDKASNHGFVNKIRSMVDGMMEMMGKAPVYVKACEDVIESEIKVPTSHDGEHDVIVQVLTPKALKGSKNNAAFVYAHGGGAVAGTAAKFKPMLSHMAINGNVVLFNVDYRLAPETKCPNNVKDFYMAIKYVANNAEKLGIDPSKIAMGGESGGGYICLGAEVLLAQNDETGLVKLAIPGIPMTDDYLFSDPAAMTIEERDNCFMMRKVWTLIAADMEKQKQDPLLFPGKASLEILQKFPPTIIFEVEFDMFITEATRMAFKLRAAGRLLEFIVIPGSKHASYATPNTKCFKMANDAYKLAFNEYLHN